MGKRKELLAWARAFDEQELGVKAYCTRAGVSVAKFYYWRRQVSEQAEESAIFVPLRVNAPGPVELVLRLPGGVEIVCGDLDRARLVELAMELDRQYAQL